MSQSNRETGHYKNVANFQALLQQCTLLQTAYKPSRSEMSINAMQLKLAQAKDLQERLAAAETTLSATVSLRAAAYAALPKLATRVMNALEFSNPGSPFAKTARHFLGKLRGARLTHHAASPAGGPEGAAAVPQSVSVSQGSFDAQVQHFARIVEAAAQEQAYQPNEPELTLESLHSVTGNLSGLNAQVVDMAYKRHMLQTERDQVLYDAHIGIVAAAASVKKYLKMVFGAQSRELKAATALAFRGK
jgi:hypothetical protein